MDQRVALIADYLRGEWSVTELATRYGVVRKTVYKWVARYVADPEHGLVEQSRAPHGHGRAMAADIRTAVLALRRQHPTWGPKKLRTVLARRDPTRAWPAASTLGDLLRRKGLSEPRRRVRYVVPLTQPLAAADAPNDVWTADFKGWFRTRDGTRCDPLTVADAYSRFVLCCRITAPSEAGVRPWFERIFREYGLPRALRTDNGPPFATTGPGQLSHLAVWWLKLGVALDRIDPGHPEQNGRHERFHLTLQQDTTTPPAATPGDQQRRFDRMRRVFNTERPHEALGQRAPATVYTASPRPYPPRLEDPWYDATQQVRRVGRAGQIKWRGSTYLSARRCAANSSASRRPTPATGACSSCTWSSAASIERRAGLRLRGMAGVSAERAARRCGNATAMEITKRFPQLFGNLAQHARFPHSHSGSSRLFPEGRRPSDLNQVLPMYPV